MALPPAPADNLVLELFKKVKEKYHLPRLAEAEIAVCFLDNKPFSKNGRFTWGKVGKFAAVQKMWHNNNKKYDFLIMLCLDAWNLVLNDAQREALVDLHLTRCTVEYEPAKEEVTVKGVVKKKIKKDDFGRVEFSDEIKRDQETGEPKWKLKPLDLYTFTENVSRYGCWCEEVLNFKTAVQKKTETP